MRNIAYDPLKYALYLNFNTTLPLWTRRLELPEIATLSIDGFSMDYLRFGNGDRPFVILPGLSVQSVMLSADAIEEAYRPFCGHFTVYVFDRRTDLPQSYSMREMAHDAEKALDALGLAHACIFGASQGGMLAMLMAIERPDIVDKLVLGSTTASVPEGRLHTVDDWVSFAKSGDAEGLYLAFGESVYPQDVFEQAHDALVEAAKSVTQDELDRFVILAECIDGFDVASELPKISCPALVIGDEYDNVLGPEASRRIAELLSGSPHVELHMYGGYGHAAYDIAPDYKERMLRFLTS